jgi:16S rRNA (guanine527-N7)-methyltransferase
VAGDQPLSPLLPELPAEGIRAALAASELRGWAADDVEALASKIVCHYKELRRWNARAGLIGPGTADQVLSRHYLESLAAAPFLDRPGVLVDVGSGAGFPGLVLGMVRRDLRTVLLERRQRKAAFLRAAIRRCALDAEVLEISLPAVLPECLPRAIDFISLRAVHLERSAWEQLRVRLVEGGRVLYWCGERPAMPDGFRLRDERPLQGSHSRRVLCLEPIRAL